MQISTERPLAGYDQTFGIGARSLEIEGRTYLKSGEPDTLHGVPKKHEILEDLDGSDIQPNIDKRQRHEAFVIVKAFGVELKSVSVQASKQRAAEKPTSEVEIKSRRQNVHSL